MSYTSIGIASYKGAKRVNWCIESIKKFSTNDGENYKIVVYDDGTPDSGQSFKQVCDKHNVPLIRSEENRGISYGWNKVSHYYDDAEILVVLNDDIIVQPDWLKCMNFFLRNNPEYAASGWPLSWCNYEEMEKLVNNEKITPRDPITKQLRPEWEGRNDGKNRCGRVMCMIGSCFAYLRENFLKVGNFDEGFKSFHEESDWGTRAAQMGMPSSGLSYPSVWHVWSATFSSCPELNAGQRIVESRKRYAEKWNVPNEYLDPTRSVFDFTNPLYMGKIPRKFVKWLDSNKMIHQEYDEGIAE